MYPVIYVTRPNWKHYNFELKLDDIKEHIADTIYEYNPLELDDRKAVVYDRNVQFVVPVDCCYTLEDCKKECECVANKIIQYINLKMIMYGIMCNDSPDTPPQVCLHVSIYSTQDLFYFPEITYAYIKEYSYDIPVV